MDGTSNVGRTAADRSRGWEPQPPEERLALLRDAFQTRFGRPPEGVAEAPGRVNLIGEHLDYNDGLVLPSAIDRSVLVAFAVRGDKKVGVYSADFREESQFNLTATIASDEQHPWANYVRGVVHVLRSEGFSGPGLDLAVAGNVPIAAGLSSSAALEIATLGALDAVWGLDLDGKTLAILGQRAENTFVGVQCGIMDQFAAALATAGHALLIDCRTLDYELVPLELGERGFAIVVAESGVSRELGPSAYNRRRQECADALGLLRGAMSDEPPQALRDVSVADLEEHEGRLPDTLRRRVRHVASEMERVSRSVVALRESDVQAFGRLMDASHVSLRDDFEVSCPELDRLVDLAQQLPVVAGSRLTGAGFGGCTINLVRSEALEAFHEAVVARYVAETGLPAKMHVCLPVDGLRSWRLD